MHLRKLVPLAELLRATGAAGAQVRGAVRRVPVPVRLVRRCARTCDPCTRASTCRHLRAPAPHLSHRHPRHPRHLSAPDGTRSEGQRFWPQAESEQGVLLQHRCRAGLSCRRDRRRASRSPSCRTRRCRSSSATRQRAWLEEIAEKVAGQKIPVTVAVADADGAAPAAPRCRATPRAAPAEPPRASRGRPAARSDGRPGGAGAVRDLPGREDEDRRDLMDASDKP